MIERSVKAFVGLFEPHNKQKLPLFKMDLTFDDEKMDFYPSFQDLEEAVLEILNSIISTLQVWNGYGLIIFTQFTYFKCWIYNVFYIFVLFIGIHNSHFVQCEYSNLLMSVQIPLEKKSLIPF